MPSLSINGKAHHYGETDFPQTGGKLLAMLKLDPQNVVAEVDEKLIPRNSFADFSLRDGMRIELASFVGGG